MPTPSPHSVPRREAIRRMSVVLGGALSGPTLAGLLSGCEVPADVTGYEPRALSPEQFRTVDQIAEMIIPATDTPGASVAGVPAFIDSMLVDFYPERERSWFLEGLAEVDAAAMSLVGHTFAEASAAERHQVLTVLDRRAYGSPSDERDDDRDRPAFMRLMKELTVAGYYTSEVGQTVELHVPPFGEFLADVPLDQVGRTWA